MIVALRGHGLKAGNAFQVLPAFFWRCSAARVGGWLAYAMTLRQQGCGHAVAAKLPKALEKP
jgi:hypothetical protein